MKAEVAREMNKLGKDSVSLIEQIEECERTLVRLIETWDKYSDRDIDDACYHVEEDDWPVKNYDEEGGYLEFIYPKEVMTRLMHSLYDAESYAEFLLPRFTYMRHEIGKRNSAVWIDKNGKEVI